ncbi:RHS repeat-associated core domain-containing protein [Stenotrophomonas sp. NPDC077464]|uniref:RHS repeat-associated core domain-containing protein n=1 Tax=unclassified Stenotrophomonas TaxID=196198 RepID=UPI0037D51336
MPSLAGTGPRVRLHAETRGWLGYNGQLHEPGGAWQFLGNGYRIYNPVLMRFHSPDTQSPFGKGGINPYAYVMGDPVNNADPSGHFLLPVAGLLGMGAMAMVGTALVAGLKGQKQSALLLGMLAGALAIGTAGALGAHAVRSARLARAARVKVPYKTLGPEEAMVWRGPKFDIVRAHGDPATTYWGERTLDGVELARMAKAAGTGRLRQKDIQLQSCYGAVGGNASQGQVLADTLGVEVTAYLGGVASKPGERMLTVASEAVLFKPQTGAARRASAIRNRELNQVVADWYRQREP